MGEYADEIIDRMIFGFNDWDTPSRLKTKRKKILMDNKTKYIEFEGKAWWARLYQPDEFRGAVRWGLDLVIDKDEEARYKASGIQKKLKEKEHGKFFPMHRPTVKLMKGKLVHFAPPVIYDKDGKALVKYVDEKGNDIRSFDDPDTTITRVGDPVLIGNGSTVKITVSYFNTQMGVGSRLESVKIIDLIEYEKPESMAEISKKMDEQSDPEMPW